MQSRLTRPPLSWITPLGLYLYGNSNQLWAHNGPQYFKLGDMYWLLPETFTITVAGLAYNNKTTVEYKVAADTVIVCRSEDPPDSCKARILLYYPPSKSWYYKSAETDHLWRAVRGVIGHGHSGACVVKDAVSAAYGKSTDPLLDLLARAYEDGGCHTCNCGVRVEHCDTCSCRCDNCDCRYEHCQSCGCEHTTVSSLKHSLPRDLQDLIPPTETHYGCNCKTEAWYNPAGTRHLGYRRVELCQYCKKLAPIFGKHDMLAELMSFYVISAAEHKAIGDKRIKPLATAFNARLAGKLANYLLLASLGEARHALRRTRDTQFDSLSKLAQALVSNALTRGREGSYLGGLAVLDHHSRIAVLRALREVFSLNWVGGFGGEAWGKCVDAAIDYETGKFNDVLFIDHTVDLEHNGGWVFNKYYEDAHLCGNPKHTQERMNDYGEWHPHSYKIKDFLDDKQQKDVLKIGDKYYECLAPEAQKAIDYAYIATH